MEGLIRSFLRLLSKQPSAYLELWGQGPLEARYREFISELGLESSVFVKGYTNDSFSVFASAGTAVFASSLEGQAITIFEAVTCGCVPVSFDFKYGPRLGIDDEETGFILDPGNYAELVDSVALLIGDSELREGMARRGIQRNTWLNSSARVPEAWARLFEELTKNPDVQSSRWRVACGWGRPTNMNERVPRWRDVTSVYATWWRMA